MGGIQGECFRSLAEGEDVEFEKQHNEAKDKWHAINVTGINGQPVIGSSRTDGAGKGGGKGGKGDGGKGGGKGKGKKGKGKGGAGGDAYGGFGEGFPQSPYQACTVVCRACTVDMACQVCTVDFLPDSSLAMSQVAKVCERCKM